MRASVVLVVVVIATGAGGAWARETPAAHGSAPKPWEGEAPLPRFVLPPAKVSVAPAPLSRRAPAVLASHAPAPWPAPAGCAASAHLTGTLVHPGDPRAYDALIRDAARRSRIDATLVAAVIRTESAFDSHAVSPAGAVGLMQLLPTTAARYGAHDLFAAAENVGAGCRHLRSLLDRYRGDVRLALAAYNAGEQRVDEGRRVPAIPETEEYVERVLRDYRARVDHR
jgi:soluble lytic murein transglycosylase-like protein